jgi:DNA-directed RNA polymerase subunit K/omega
MAPGGIEYTGHSFSDVPAQSGQKPHQSVELLDRRLLSMVFHSLHNPLPPASRLSRMQPPTGMGHFEFATLAALRAAQLIRGCVPTIQSEQHKSTIIAQYEVATGRISHAVPEDADDGTADANTSEE